MWKFKGVIISEKGFVHNRNDLDLIISASNYYYFWSNMKTCILKLLQDKKNKPGKTNLQDMEYIVINLIEFPT